MTDLTETLQQYGKALNLTPGQVLCRQGTTSDGLYYLKSGRLGVYKEQQDSSYRLSEIAPGGLVGEVGATTGWQRTATVKAEEPSTVIHVSEADFRRALDESPALAAEIFRLMGERLTDADVARITLGRSYQQAAERVQDLSSQKAQLEELLRLREELADMIVHDLRNPLSVIDGGLQILANAPVVGDDQEYVTTVLETMERATRRMQRLVDTLLDIARLEEGQLALNPQLLELLPLVEGLLDEQRPLAESKSLALEHRLPTDLPPLLADHDTFQRLLANLLDNAIKFTPAGGRVWIEARPQGEAVQIAVIDTGPGIPPQERERIFEKFTQVQGMASSRRGSGLGLAFCRMVAEAHGGRLWVEDGPEGRGSRFILTLPPNSA